MNTKHTYNSLEIENEWDTQSMHTHMFEVLLKPTSTKHVTYSPLNWPIHRKISKSKNDHDKENTYFTY